MHFRRNSPADRALRLAPFLLLQAAALASAASVSLFQPWNATEWVASDDSVRGGLSESNLEVLAAGATGNPYSDASVARFYGTLDYEALNGSGFASRRTADDWAGLDLAAYDRLVLQVPFADGKTYSLNLKDTVLPPVNGVEQASVSWEYNFLTTASTDSYQEVEILFADLVPTYRGSVLNDTAPLDLSAIKRVNIMIRRLVHISCCLVIFVSDAGLTILAASLGRRNRRAISSWESRQSWPQTRLCRVAEALLV